MKAYADAIAEWTELSNREGLTDGEYILLEAAEVTILNHRPQSVEEVLRLLSILRGNLAAGPRSDARDVRALMFVEAYLGAPV